MQDMLVTIATFTTLVEASMAKNRLEAEGIRIFLADAETVGMVWHLTSAFGGIKLQVTDDYPFYASVPDCLPRICRSYYSLNLSKNEKDIAGQDLSFCYIRTKRTQQT